jgi:hypothetical protein
MAWEGHHARDAAWNACVLGFAGGVAAAMARVGAAGQFLRAQAPAEKCPRLEGRFITERDTPPRRLAQNGVPAHRAARLSREHRQQRVGAARPWRWGALSPPPRSPCGANQNGTTAKTPDLRRDASSAQSTTARRGDVLSSSSKTARTSALTSPPGRRGLG